MLQKMKSEMADNRTNALYSMLRELRDRLQVKGDRLVLAESCTSGLVAAELGQIPGISEIFCGSMVVYRTATKSAWLDIPAALLEDPGIGPVSPEATESLAWTILERTPEATIAASITGHLGPGSPPVTDGWVHCAFVRRNQPRDSLKAKSLKLTSPPPSDLNDLAGRAVRQREAASTFIEFIREQITA